MGQVAQDVFRLHVLTSASSPDVARPLYIDRVQAHRMDGPALDVAQHRSVIKAVLHRASGGCICGLHRVKLQPGRLELAEVRPALRRRGGARTAARTSPSSRCTWRRLRQELQGGVWCVHEKLAPAAKVADGVDAAPGRPTARACR